MNGRFEIILDPCDQYLIWDNDSGVPATLGMKLAAFAAAEEAERVAACMNTRDHDATELQKPVRTPALMRSQSGPATGRSSYESLTNAARLTRAEGKLPPDLLLSRKS